MSPDPFDGGRSGVVARHDVSRETSDRLDIYVGLLKEWQQKTNLVAPSTLPEVWSRHVADSLQFTEIAPGPLRWVDLGSGGGFPGIVIAIVLADRPGAHVDLVESNEKKAAFLRAAIRACGLKAEVHARRIETCGALLPAAEAVSARALAPLDRLLGFVSEALPASVPCYFAKGQAHGQEILDASAHWVFSVVKHPSRVEPGSVVLEIRNITPSTPSR